MIVKSYLVFPVEGQLSKLMSDLEAIPGCEATAATNRELVVLVTETNRESDEKDLEDLLRKISSLQALTLVSGHNAG